MISLRVGASVVSTHSRLKAAGSTDFIIFVIHIVSTHSRLKAAGQPAEHIPKAAERFNTQPPEGGWVCAGGVGAAKLVVSTHSRLKAAGSAFVILNEYKRFQHTAA